MKYLRPQSRDVFDEMFNNMFEPFFPALRSNRNCPSMKTDVTEQEDSYLLEIDLAGFAKENISLNLENGYLTVSATNEKEDEKKEHGYIRKERYTGSCSRSYYVGDVTEKDVTAKYEHGVLTLEVKKESKKLPTAKQIAIQ